LVIDEIPNVKEEGTSIRLDEVSNLVDLIEIEEGGPQLEGGDIELQRVFKSYQDGLNAAKDDLKIA